VQEWSDACRRCKSDLRLLRACAAAYQRNRRICLEHLRSGSPQVAIKAARRCHVLRADADSHRLLALAALLSGEWTTAVTLARQVLQDG
jgi:hypothetical protein